MAIQAELRRAIRQKLDDNRLTQVWLVHVLADEGIRTSKVELSEILREVRFGPKAESIVYKSAEILKRYEKTFRKGTK